MDATEFHGLIAGLTKEIAGRPLDERLQTWLNAHHGTDSSTGQSLREACMAGVAQGWMCQREHAGIRYGRVIAPSESTQGFSVDVVDMDNTAGGHHRHPKGEIVFTMPLTPGAEFCGRGAGWTVYPPDSQHTPSVRGGHALVLYMLPQGAIEFTR